MMMMMAMMMMMMIIIIIMLPKYYNRNRQQMQTAHNLMRQCNTSYRHVLYWLNNNTYRDMIQCALNCTLTYATK
jgi:hypothetical protein